MTYTDVSKPECCKICGYYLTTGEEYAGSRCIDPAHWQAAGLLAPGDFYPMARIAAWANAELKKRLGRQKKSSSQVSYRATLNAV